MLCHNYPPHPGGLEVMVRNLANGLARRHEVTLVTTAFDGVEGRAVEAGMTVWRVPAIHVTERMGIPYPIPMGDTLGAALRSLTSVDLLHAHGALYATTIYASRLARRRTVPFVITEHVGFVEYGNPIVNAVESVAWSTIGDRVMKETNAVTTYNSRVQQWLGKRYPSRDIRFIGNGVDTATFRARQADERAALRQSFGLPDDRPLILFAARDSEKKNLGDVLQLTRDRFHLVVCGAARGLAGEHLTDLGVVPYDRMSGLFGCVDAMVHASTGEGFPLAVQEGLASGLPIALLWDPGYAAWLDRSTVVACDSIGQLGEAVQSLASDATLRHRLARAGREWTERKWSWDATVQAYEQVYADVTHTKAASRAVERHGSRAAERPASSVVDGRKTAWES
jgi:glycosyltransferase involved in cell wall biosynthesis